MTGEKNKNVSKFSVSGEKIFGMEVWQIKALLPVLVVVLVIVVSVGLFIVPKINQIKEYRGKIRQTEEKIVDINQKRAYLQSIDEADLKAKEDILLMAMPESKDIYFLLNVVSGVVGDYGFMVDGFSFSPGELKEIEDGDIDSVGRISFSINLIGPVDRYIELVDGLESSLPILSLDELDSKLMGEAMTEVNLKMATYFVFGKQKVDVSKLAYKDLLLSQHELELIEKISKFKKIEGLYVVDNKLGSGRSYEEYEIKNPFQN